MQQMVEHVAERASRGRVRAVGYAASDAARRSRSRPRARSARSRAWPAAAAARRCPGSCSRRSIPARSTGSRRGSPRGSVLVSATNGKTTTTAMVAEILGGTARLQPLGREPALRGRLHPPRVAAAPSSACSRSTRRRCPRSPGASSPRVVALGNLFRDQLDRYGELEHVAERWRGAVAELPDALLVVNADDPLLGELARGRERVVAYGLDDPRHARAVAAARGRLEVLPASAARRTTTPPPTSGTSATTAARTAARRAAAARRRRARDRAARPRRHRVHARRRPAGSARVELALPGPLQRLQRDRGGRGRRGARRAARGDRGRPRALHGRVRPLRADPGRRQAAADAADQEPGRRERGGADAARRLSPTPRRRRAERRDRRRPRRLVDLGRRLRAAARRPRARRRRRATARPSWRCASPTAGSTATGSRSCPALEAALDRGLELTAAGGELVVLPTYTAMLGAARDRRRPRARARVLGAARREDPRRPPLPGATSTSTPTAATSPCSPARAAARGHELEVDRDRARRRRRRPGSTSSTSAAARIASRSSSRPTSPRKAEALREAVDGRRRVPRRLRRLPAARPLLPRPRGRRAARASACCRSTRSPASGG